MQFLYTAVAILAAYLVGSVSFAVVVSRMLGLAVPRTYGSKNPGATNEAIHGMAIAIAGGEEAVRFSDNCSGALAISSDGLVVTALSLTPAATGRDAAAARRSSAASSPRQRWR